MFPDCDACFFCNFQYYCHYPDGFFLFTMNSGNVEASRLQTSISPADLHGMWYPTVRRTLVCLSKLYRCIDVSLKYLVFTDVMSFILKHGRMSSVYSFFSHFFFLTVTWLFSREQSSRAYLRKPYLHASSPF